MSQADTKREARELAATMEDTLRTLSDFESRRAGRAGVFSGDRAAIQAQVDKLRAFGGQDEPPTVAYEPPAKEEPPEEPKCSYCGQPMVSCGGNCWATG